MNSFTSITDNDWFVFLSQQPGIDEVNFWQLRELIFHAVMSVENMAIFLMDAIPGLGEEPRMNCPGST